MNTHNDSRPNEGVGIFLSQKDETAWKLVPKICMDCGLLKETNEYGVEVWPEPYLTSRGHCKPGSAIWKRGSHGLCPECYDVRVKGVK